MSPILSLLTSRWAGPIAIVVALGLAAGLLTANVKLGRRDDTIRGLQANAVALTAERDRARTDLGRCQATGVALGTALDRQNAAVETLRAQGLARQAEATRLASEAARTRPAAERRAETILRPVAGADACARAEAAAERVRESLR